MLVHVVATVVLNLCCFHINTQAKEKQLFMTNEVILCLHSTCMYFQTETKLVFMCVAMLKLIIIEVTRYMYMYMYMYIHASES